MWLEGERPGRPTERVGARPRSRDHCTMPAMHPVEIADRDHRAVERRVVRFLAAHHDEGSFRLRVLAHDLVYHVSRRITAFG